MRRLLRKLKISNTEPPLQSRDATPHDPSRPSLAVLPRDVLLLITDILQESSSSDPLQACSLVCSSLYCVARYSQHRGLTLDLDKEDIKPRCDRIEALGLLPAVQNLTVVSHGRSVRSSGNDKQDPEAFLASQWSAFQHILLQMTGLKTVKFQTKRIPRGILDALGDKPNVELETIVNPDGYALGQGVALPQDDNLALLQGNKNLRALEFTLGYIGPQPCQIAMPLLKQILLSCPNLRRLSLNVTLPTSGCVVHVEPQEYCGLGFANGEGLPPLEELNVINYPFGKVRRTGLNAQGFEAIFGTDSSIGYNGSIDELQYWAESLDCSRLQRIKGPPDLLLGLMPRLNSLKEVTFLDQWGRQKIADFYNQVPASLAKISVSKVQDVTLEGIQRHASSLESLHIHQLESPTWHDEAMDLDTLQKIHAECHLISTLEIDVGRSGTWPYPIFDVLAAFPRLRHLEIWFELGVGDQDNPVKPYVTFAAAKHIFDYIRSHAPHGRSPLRTLVLHSGAPPKIGFGFPSPMAFWATYNSTEFVCELSERDDEAEQGVFSVNYPGMGSPAATKMGKRKKTLRQSHVDKTLQAIHEGRRIEEEDVATNGPRRASTWRSHY